MNLSRLKTVIIAPMTSTIKDNFPTRVLTEFKDKKGQIALDQLRSIDRTRMVKKLGVIEIEAQNKVLELLSIIFQK
jgi:mRNA interferase MazF